MNLEPYRRYKPTGIDWLGKVPEHWELKRGRFCIRVNPPSDGLRQLNPEDEVSFVPMEAIGEYGGISLDQTRVISDVGLGYTEFDNGDILVAKITPCFENGKGALAADLLNGAAFGTTELHILRSAPNLESNFLFYFTVSRLFRSNGEGEMYGAGGQKRVPSDFCKNIPVPLPSMDEQCVIAEFLDRETSKIDTLVAKKRTLIERLKEKRIALISRTVTRGLPPKAATACGLDPHPKLKPSGIDWLGEVPEHWDAKQLRRLAHLQSGEAITTEEMEDGGNYPVYGGNGIRGFTTNFTHCGEFILIGRQGAQCGNINYASTEFWASEHAIVVSPIEGWSTRWMGELLRAMDLNQYSQSAAQPGLSVDRILALSVPVPPSCEQHTIANFIEHETAKINRLVAKIEIAIERLNEYRTALITAAVTGKINVRKADIEVKGEQS